MGVSHTAPGEILFATDFGETARRALTCAKQVARLRGAAIHAIHVIDLMETSGKTHESFSAAQESAQRCLRQFRRELRLSGIPSAATVISAGAPAHAIHTAALRYNTQMLAMGLHGERPMMAPAPGSNTKLILHRATYPVLTVGLAAADHPGFERVLFVTDGAQESLEAALQAWPVAAEQPAPSLLAVLAEEGSAAASIDPHPLFLRRETVSAPHAAAAVLAACHTQQPGLVVVGLRCGGSLDSVAQGGVLRTLIANACCPVLTVRG